MTRTFMAVMFAMGMFLTGTQAKAALTLSYSIVSHSVPPAGTDLMHIDCPTGTRVMSGGWDTTPSTGRYLMVWVSRQIGNSWRIMTVNTHPTAFLGINGYAVCVSGVSGLSSYSVAGYNGPVNVPPLATGSGDAVCNNGGIVTGGGFDSNFPDPTKLVPIQTRPAHFLGLTQWMSVEYNLTNQAKTFTMFATCTKNLNGSLALVGGFQQTVPGNSSMTATADCPSGDLAVGGGYSTSVNTTTPAVHVPLVRTFGNLPATTNPRRWSAKVFNGSTSNFAFVTAYANCLHLN